MHFEGLAGAINVSIVAFSIVFGVLLLLTGTIFAMKLFAGGGEKKNEVIKTPAQSSATPKATPVTAPAAPVIAQAASADKTKIIAAITAAIVEFTGNQNFQIMSVTPEIPEGVYAGRAQSRWKTAGMLALNSNGLIRKWN